MIAKDMRDTSWSAPQLSSNSLSAVWVQNTSPGLQHQKMPLPVKLGLPGPAELLHTDRRLQSTYTPPLMFDHKSMCYA